MTTTDLDLDPLALVQRLRDAVAEDGRTHYAIAKAAGIEPDILDRFASGRDLYLTTAAKIALVVGLDLVPIKKGRRRVKA
jgi:hypothetical protein